MNVDLRLCREASVTEVGASIQVPLGGTPPAEGAAAPVEGKPAEGAAAAAAAAAEGAAAGAFAIPDAYKDKPYLKGVDSQEKLLKMLDGAQELIGKRGPAIPAVDAPQAEKDAYYEAIGRPKTAAEYQFEGTEKADPNFLTAVKETFHKRGLSAEQAKGVYADINATLTKIATDKGLADAQADTDFEKMAVETFGTRRDQVLTVSKALIDAHTPPSMKGAVSKLSNESLIVLAGVLDGINAKYIKQDGAPLGGPKATGSTPAEISAKARELMMSAPYKDVTHPQHATVVKQVQDLYAPLRTK